LELHGGKQGTGRILTNKNKRGETLTREFGMNRIEKVTVKKKYLSQKETRRKQGGRK